ncbi:hypothetical protein VST7929_01238 [Vibrio stylophorae]|uniref:Response regulatory domain-containing protein n=1 Tax=Vibrio stylophorae TaxID=659351 RepID=A0ABM8ZST2_9VIBR|nr:response regulator [Vibrio stylophorae]CAH0533372.1 hypothetical protein VST7929_01238 [Vibrio stylophorae]
MNRYLILCVDDEREVLDSVIQDLSELSSHFDIEATESVSEAEEVLAESIAQGVPLALALCDHIMPGRTGVDFLLQLGANESTQSCRKVLLTGQAGLEETVQALNHESLDYYIAKPWDGKALKQVVIQQLSQFIIASEQQLMPWLQVLDAEMLMAAMNDRRLSLNFDEF